MERSSDDWPKVPEPKVTGTASPVAFHHHRIDLLLPSEKPLPAFESFAQFSQPPKHLKSASLVFDRFNNGQPEQFPSSWTLAAMRHLRE